MLLGEKKNKCLVWITKSGDICATSDSSWDMRTSRLEYVCNVKYIYICMYQRVTNVPCRNHHGTYIYAYIYAYICIYIYIYLHIYLPGQPASLVAHQALAFNCYGVFIPVTVIDEQRLYFHRATITNLIQFVLIDAMILITRYLLIIIY